MGLTDSLRVMNSRDVSAGSRRDWVSRVSRETTSKPFEQPTQSLDLRKWMEEDSEGM